MNNMNFSKNPFDMHNNKTSIAGSHVFKQGDGGRTSLEDIRSNMSGVKNSKIEKKLDKPVVNDNQVDISRNRIQSLRNLERK